MLPLARQNRRSFTRSQRRPNRGWSGLVETVFTTVSANTKVLLGNFVPTNPGIDVTVLRTVGSISIRSDNFAASELQMGAFGLIMVTDIALAAGIASIPDPVSNPDDDWFVYQGFQNSTLFSDATGIVTQSAISYAFDSKAKRIVSGDGIAIAIVVANAQASHGLEAAVNLRILAQVRGTG